MSESRLRALEILSECDEITARLFAERMWPDSDGWKRIHNIGNGATSGSGMWQAGGSYLGKLVKLGFVTRRVSRTNQNIYYLNFRGGKELERLRGELKQV